MNPAEKFKKDWDEHITRPDFREEFERIRRMSDDEWIDYIYQKKVDRAKARAQAVQDLRK